MKNLKYFPYERNKYFYGKLLSVDDFETEQKYMNDKRRLINRFMHGCGVVCGLNVVPIGDDSVSIEAGMALDFAGREIIMEKPVTRNLKDIEGFSSCFGEGENNGYLYLCIEYAEQEKDPVYSVAGGSSSGDKVCYNKVAEGYHIYLTGQEPEQGIGGSDAYYEKWETVYWGNGIRISQVFPRYAGSGNEFDFRIVVENMGQKLPVTFRYELEFECLKYDGKSRKLIEFDEEKQKKSRRYEIPVTLRASAVKEVRGTAKMKRGSFELTVGGHNIEADAYVESITHITAEKVSEVIKRRYYECAMQEIKKDTYHQSIFLAKISLIQAGTTVVADWVEQMPFGQYICSDVLSAIGERTSAEEQKYFQRRLFKERRTEKEHSIEGLLPENVPLIATGTVFLDLGIGGIAGQKYFSESITHGLGLGNVRIILGEAYSDRDDSSVLYGSGSVFEEDVCKVKGEMAAKADTKQGTFVIGLRLLEPTTEGKVKIHWMALRDGKEQMLEKSGRELFIKPDMVYLSLREDYYFEPVFTGVHDTRVVWSVKGEDGGSIDQNGLYTAPGTPGIYEIMVRSAAYPELSNSAFAVVREIRQEL